MSRHRSKETSKLHITGLCTRNSPVTGEFTTTQRASKAKKFPFDDAIMTIIWKWQMTWMATDIQCRSWPDWCHPLQWRYNGHDSISNHQPHNCLFNHLFRRRSKKTSKLHVTGLCAIPHTNGQLRGKCFHLMTSSCIGITVLKFKIFHFWFQSYEDILHHKKIRFIQTHDDVKRKHFLWYWPLWGNSAITSKFPSQRPVTQSFDVVFDRCLNKQLSKQLRRQWFEMPSCSLLSHCDVS